VCGVGCVWPCPRLWVAFCFLSSACMERCLECPFRHFPLALGYVFDPLKHTRRFGCASFVMCVCIDGILNLQHAQHGACSCLHSRIERLAHILPHVFDPQKCVCVLGSGWFWCHFGSFVQCLHPSRSNHHCLNQHKFRMQTVSFVCIVKPCIERNVKWDLFLGIALWDSEHQTRRRTALLQQAHGTQSYTHPAKCRDAEGWWCRSIYHLSRTHMSPVGGSGTWEVWHLLTSSLLVAVG
jgi:hypothetical protein